MSLTVKLDSTKLDLWKVCVSDLSSFQVPAGHLVFVPSALWGPSLTLRVFQSMISSSQGKQKSAQLLTTRKCGGISHSGISFIRRSKSCLIGTKSRIWLDRKHFTLRLPNLTLKRCPGWTRTLKDWGRPIFMHVSMWFIKHPEQRRLGDLLEKWINISKEGNKEKALKVISEGDWTLSKIKKCT